MIIIPVAKKFQQITILDKVTLTDNCLIELGTYSAKRVKVFKFDSQDQTEIQKRMTDSDCILLSWRTPINKKLLATCPSLQFIGLCATNSDCIDLIECSQRNIAVSNVRDYGDEGVVEWIIHQLLSLVRGLGRYQWKDNPAEFSGKVIGIIGLGVVGKLLAQAALGLKMKVLYYSRTRNRQWEKRGIVFAKKEDLLVKSDFISLQTPKDLKILTTKDFALMKGKILINSTLGRAFARNDFIDWINKPNNYAIMDAAPDFADEFSSLDRVIYSKFVSGLTKEAEIRLSQKTVQNVSSYLAGKPINVISGQIK
ncbi:dihydrofolate reductase [Patescibacteria group bacterium]|nr:dihydrofolate reductase [Patescibacteria group bacterium]